MPLHFAPLYSVILPMLLQFHLQCSQIFTERIWIRVIDKEPPAQRSCHLLAQHLRIAARHINPVFRISQATHELVPVRYVLHLVQKNHRLLAIQFQMSLQKTVEILRLKFCQALILKVHKQHLVPSHSCCLQLTHTLIQQIRFTCMSHANYHIVAILLKIYWTVHNNRLIHLSLLTDQALFYDIFTDTHINYDLQLLTVFIKFALQKYNFSIKRN